MAAQGRRWYGPPWTFLRLGCTTLPCHRSTFPRVNKFGHNAGKTDHTVRPYAKRSKIGRTAPIKQEYHVLFVYQLEANLFLPMSTVHFWGPRRAGKGMGWIYIWQKRNNGHVAVSLEFLVGIYTKPHEKVGDGCVSESWYDELSRTARGSR